MGIYVLLLANKGKAASFSSCLLFLNCLSWKDPSTKQTCARVAHSVGLTAQGASIQATWSPGQLSVFLPLPALIRRFRRLRSQVSCCILVRVAICLDFLIATSLLQNSNFRFGFRIKCRYWELHKASAWLMNLSKRASLLIPALDQLLCITHSTEVSSPWTSLFPSQSVSGHYILTTSPALPQSIR